MRLESYWEIRARSPSEFAVGGERKNERESELMGCAVKRLATRSRDPASGSYGFVSLAIRNVTAFSSSSA